MYSKGADRCPVMEVSGIGEGQLISFAKVAQEVKVRWQLAGPTNQTVASKTEVNDAGGVLRSGQFLRMEPHPLFSSGSSQFVQPAFGPRNELRCTPIHAPLHADGLSFQANICVGLMNAPRQAHEEDAERKKDELAGHGTADRQGSRQSKALVYVQEPFVRWDNLFVEGVVERHRSTTHGPD